MLGKIAEQEGATPAQIALAWILAQADWIVPIPGTTKIHRLQENIKASGVKLGEENLQQIEQAVSKINIKGERYPESSQKMVDN